MPAQPRPSWRYILPVGVTGRCDLSCPWCHHCRRPDQPAPGFDPPGAPPEGAVTVRLTGGDPLGYGELPRAIAWARQNPRAHVEVEGHACSLRGDDDLRTATAHGLDLLRLTLPGVDPDLVGAWTGQPALVERTLRALATLPGMGLPVHAVIPVNVRTVATLVDTAMAVAAQAPGVPVVLARAPLRAPHGSRAVLEDPAVLWGELGPLADALRVLRDALPPETPLWIDDMEGWGACVVPQDLWTPDLLPLVLGDDHRDPARRVDPAACGGCALANRCAWELREPQPPPREHLRPLDAPAAKALCAQAGEDPSTAAPSDAALPEALLARLCVAPWTTLTLYSQGHHPVPCAPAWVDTALDLPSLQRDGFVPVGRLMRVEDYDGGNEDWSLHAMWNAPLYRQMRAQMAGGGASSRCRASCRVILGVEERGKPFFRIPDASLSPSVRENRRRLLEEILAGRDLLTATPLELTLGVSAHCNFTCGFCTGPQGVYGELTEARLTEVLAWLPGLMQLSVVGPGEPLMSVTFQKLLAEIGTGRYPSLRLSLTTNGTLLRPSWLAKHEGICWGQLRLSINAGSAATHARMTGKQLWAQLMENLDAVVAMRDKRDGPFTLALSCVLSQTVAGDLMNFAAIVDRAGALPILEPMTGNLNNLSPYVRADRTRAMRDECQAVADRYAGRNEAVASAFDAMARFADERLRATLDPLPAS
ncbi:MAG: radical SAM protein [Polyangiales bacterium]